MEYNYRDKLNDSISFYTTVTGIKCSLFKINKVIEQRIQSMSAGQADIGSDCLKAHMDAVTQVGIFGDFYSYYCPTGLMHWLAHLPSPSENVCVRCGPVRLKGDNSLQQFEKSISHLSASETINARLWFEKLPEIEASRAKDLVKLFLLMIQSVQIEQQVVLQGGKEQLVTGTVLKKDVVHRQVEWDRLSRSISSEKPAEAEPKPERQAGKRPVDGVSLVLKNFQHRAHNWDIDTSNPDDLLHPFAREKELLNKVQSGDRQGTQELLEDLLNKSYKFNDFKLFKLQVINLLVMLMRVAAEVGINIEDIFGLELSCINQVFSISEYEPLVVEANWCVTEFLNKVFSSVRINMKNRGVVFKAVNFIRKNYNKICLDDVATEVSLNAAYLSKIFKEEMGISYSDFLNKTKIEAAKDYLLKDVPLAEAALLVGFNDQSYFTKIFKKFEGVSPMVWKKNEFDGMFLKNI